MPNKRNDVDLNEINTKRKKRKKKKKASKFFKGVLIFISFIVVAISAFLITIKVAMPDFDLASLVSKNEIASVVSQKLVQSVILKETTTACESTTTQSVTISEKYESYYDFDVFDFNTSRQGSYIGNLLQGGKVGSDFTYIYYAVDKSGIYRFNPNTESYAVIYPSKDNIGSLNLRGDYIYFVNHTKNQLCKMRKGSSDAKVIAENVSFAYVYDSNVYFITTTNSIYNMDVKTLKPVKLYSAGDDRIDFVGISLDRVFFTVTEKDSTVKFISVDKYAHSRFAYFRNDAKADEICFMQMENGFMYYYQLQSDGKYNLCRQKFGSQKVVTLVKGLDNVQYSIVDENKLYYAKRVNNALLMQEINMNSSDEKTLLKVKNSSDNLSIQHGAQYDFIIGDNVYAASCIDTSSTNIMKLDDNNKWKY